jgi:hypothetical protein
MKQELKLFRDTLDRNRGREPLEDLAAEVGRAMERVDVDDVRTAFKEVAERQAQKDPPA